MGDSNNGSKVASKRWNLATLKITSFGKLSVQSFGKTPSIIQRPLATIHKHLGTPANTDILPEYICTASFFGTGHDLKMAEKGCCCIVRARCGAFLMSIKRDALCSTGNACTHTKQEAAH